MEFVPYIISWNLTSSRVADISGTWGTRFEVNRGKGDCFRARGQLGRGGSGQAAPKAIL